MVLIALYTFDYCMLAVLLRNLLSGRIKAIYTWVFAILLTAMGAALPTPVLFLFQNEEFRTGRVDPWWQISNPFATILTCMEGQGGDAEIFRINCLYFLGGWGLGLLLASLPWMTQQVRRFRPNEEN